MMLLITRDVQTQISAIVERATADPVAMETIVANRIDGEVTLERRQGKTGGTARLGIILSDHFRCAFSIELQPSGPCRHLSVSVLTKGKCPDIHVMGMIAEAFGFTKPQELTWQDAISQQISMIAWLEEFEPEHHAVNLLQPSEQKSDG
jgi:hypothetical protein